MTEQIQVNGQPESLATSTLEALLRTKGVAPGAKAWPWH